MDDLMLNELLNEGQIFSAEYGNQLSSHLPMTLIALDRIGANDEKLQAFYNRYTTRLSLQKESTFKIDLNNWKDYLGLHQHNSEYREFFLKEIQEKGIDLTFSNYLPPLIPGLSGGAFHPLIRLAYAIEIQNHWEIAEALASWAMAYQELGEFSSTKETSNLISILEKISLDDSLKSLNFDDAPNIFSLMKMVSTNSHFLKYISQFEIDEKSLSKIAEASLYIYASSKDDFTALHCVTSTHAARIVLPYIQNQERFFKFLWQGIAAAYATIIHEDKVDSHSLIDHGFTWEQIFSKAKKSPNDHVIKFCYTAYQEELFYKNPRYRLLATKKSGVMDEVN